MNVEAVRFIASNLCEYHSKTINLKCYECLYIINGNFKLHDHSEYKFISKDELLNYDLYSVDIPWA